MMTIGHCANKVSVCFVLRNPRSCAGLIFCIVFLFLFFRGVVNAHAKHRNGVPEGLPTPRGPSLPEMSSISSEI